MAQNSLDWLTK